MRLSLGITGHRDTNAAFRANAAQIETVLSRIFDVADSASGERPKPRLHALLALGADLLAVEIALKMGWQVAAPLPFGKALNAAINAQPTTVEEAQALLDGNVTSEGSTATNARHILDIAGDVTCLELSERDAKIADLFLQSLANKQSREAAEAFAVAASERAALAGQVMIEQIDLLVAVWDGNSPGPVGGTRHTISRALEMGLDVLWIDAGKPNDLRLLSTPEALANRWKLAVLPGEAALRQLLAGLLPLDETGIGNKLLDAGKIPARSSRFFHAYRRIEAMFAGEVGTAFRSLKQSYADEEDVVSGDPMSLRGSANLLPHRDVHLIERTENEVLRRFARADALATYLSDAYRGGMVANLLLAAFAVIGGIAYLPLVDAALKWPFALFEFLLLALILAIIAIGRKREWHGRWFQTRRVAEYLRHAPFMLMLGVARPAYSWPHSEDTGWPEDYVRSILREIGLPNCAIDQRTLRIALENWIGAHVSAQRTYHQGKAVRLNRIHENLERISERLFMLAMFVVAIYLIGELAAVAGLVPVETVRHFSKLFTFLGVALPTLGGALAGIHYFADFGRFAAISESTASRLESVEQRIGALLAAPPDELDYGRVANLVRAVDEIVVSEIEHWQDVFGGKHISVPV